MYVSMCLPCVCPYHPFPITSPRSSGHLMLASDTGGSSRPIPLSSNPRSRSFSVNCGLHIHATFCHVLPSPTLSLFTIRCFPLTLLHVP